MFKYNATNQHTKKYLTRFCYYKCLECKNGATFQDKTCSKCQKSKNPVFEIKEAKLKSYTINYNNQTEIGGRRPLIMGLIIINKEIELTAQIVDTEIKEIKEGIHLQPVLRKLFKDKLLGYIQYAIKFRKI